MWLSTHVCTYYKARDKTIKNKEIKISFFFLFCSHFTEWQNFLFLFVSFVFCFTNRGQVQCNGWRIIVTNEQIFRQNDRYTQSSTFNNQKQIKNTREDL